MTSVSLRLHSSSQEDSILKEKVLCSVLPQLALHCCNVPIFVLSPWHKPCKSRISYVDFTRPPLACNYPRIHFAVYAGNVPGVKVAAVGKARVQGLGLLSP